MFKSAFRFTAIVFLGFAAEPVFAQTIGYADALDQLAVACGADIAIYCKNENLGAGRVRDCLLLNQSKVAARCIGSVNSLGALLQKRAAARASVMSVCDVVSDVCIRPRSCENQVFTRPGPVADMPPYYDFPAFGGRTRS